MKVIGVSGMSSMFGPHRGETTTDVLLSVLRDRYGYPVLDFNYDPVFFWQTRSRKRQRAIARRLVEVSDPGDILLTHSFGSIIADRAMSFPRGEAAMYSDVFMFRPAVREDNRFAPHGFERLWLVRNATDEALQKTALLPYRHDMGRLGSLGYQGPKDGRVRDVNVADLFPSVMLEKRNHSLDFKEPYVSHWASFIHSLIAPRFRGQRMVAAENEEREVEVL